MKKKTYLSCLAALGVLASFTSCSESESLEHSGLSDDRIVFSTTLDNSGASQAPASSSRAAKDAAKGEEPIVVPTSYGKPLYLHSMEQNGIYIWSRDGKRITRSGTPLPDGYQESAVQTRGAQKKELSDYDSFGVSAWYRVKPGVNEWTSVFQKDGKADIAVPALFDNNNIWEIKGSRWPESKNCGITAFAPYSTDATSFLQFETDIPHEITKITYTASAQKDEIAKQPDLIYATAVRKPSINPTALKFRHALTAVNFAIAKDMLLVVGAGKQLTKVELRGIPNKGTCSLKYGGNYGDEPNATWTLGPEKATYTFDFTDKNIIVGKDDYALTLGDSTLMMIPQTLPDGAEVAFYLKDNGIEKEYKIPIKGHNWYAGRTLTYLLSAARYEALNANRIFYDNSWNTATSKQLHNKTGFGTGDRFGLYVVSNSGEVIHENLRGNQVGVLIYMAKRFPFSPANCKYFLYYPYREGSLKVNLKAETAEEFFKDEIDNLKIVEDQSDTRNHYNADFQVGKFYLNAQGKLETQMKHQVGLVHLEVGACYIGKADFKNDSWKFFYGDKSKKRPVYGEDYGGHVNPDLSSGKVGIMPSADLVGNKAYIQNDYTDYFNKRILTFIVPFNKKVSFKAPKDPKEKRMVNSWGYLADYSYTLTKDNPVVDATGEFDVPLNYISQNFISDGQTVIEFPVFDLTDYDLECYGSQGRGYIPSTLGYPGMSKGTWTATEEVKTLYLCLGDQYGFNNGKGYITDRWGNYLLNYAGGGGSHIATKKWGTGETRFYKDHIQDLLLVAGGGGASTFKEKSWYQHGDCRSGSGGGEKGSFASFQINLDNDYLMDKKASPGSVASAGVTLYLGDIYSTNKLYGEAEFGVGGYAASPTYGYGPQGGGGFYGGGGVSGSPRGSGAAGGSGYINPILTKTGQTSTNFYYMQDTHPDKGNWGKSSVRGACRIGWKYNYDLSKLIPTR